MTRRRGIARVESGGPEDESGKPARSFANGVSDAPGNSEGARPSSYNKFIETIQIQKEEHVWTSRKLLGPHKGGTGLLRKRPIFFPW